MHELGSFRDERAIPLFCYILGHVDHRGPLRPIYETALGALGGLGGPDAVVALKGALYRGEWYAPTRTAALRRAAAAPWKQIGSSEATAALAEAAERGPRAVRAIAREHLGLGRIR